jgi:TolA-binding protein
MRPFVLDALAKTYEAQDKYAQAEAAWTSIIQLPGGMLKAEAHLSLGRIYEAQGDEARAQAEYELVTEKFGDSPGARLAAAKLHK